MYTCALLAALTALVAVNVEDDGIRVRQNGETKVTGAFGKRQVTIVLATREWPTTDVMGEHDAKAFGETASVVRSLTIAVDDHLVWVPRSSYADLVDVARARLEVGARGMSVIIQGGDASTAYEARLEFDGTGVKGRKLFSGKLLTEEIVYRRHVIP